MQTIDAKVHTYKTATHDIHNLKMAIALKTNQYNFTTWSERDFLRTEVEPLTTGLHVIQAYEASAPGDGRAGNQTSDKP